MAQGFLFTVKMYLHFLQLWLSTIVVVRVACSIKPYVQCFCTCLQSSATAQCHLHLSCSIYCEKFVSRIVSYFTVSYRNLTRTKMESSLIKSSFGQWSPWKSTRRKPSVWLWQVFVSMKSGFSEFWYEDQFS